MNRQQERILLGVLGVVLAVMVMFAGVQILGSRSNGDVAAGGPALPGEVEEEVAVDPTELLPQDPVSSTTTAIQVTTSTTLTTTSSTTTSTSTTAPTTTESTTTAEDTTSTVAETTSSVVEESTTSSTTADASSTTETTVDDGGTTSTTEAETTTTTTTQVESTTTTAASSELTALEQEIVRLTNALRANPSGELRRRGAMPACVDEEFYSITVDPDTGHPAAVPALSLNRQVSLQMARDWSQQMAAADQMTHRTQDSQRAIYAALGINWSSFGENVARAQGHPESSIAFQFFSGWRESDTGHYCSMMSGQFTHFGVGHHRTAAGKDWGTQNFYSLR